MDERIRVGVDVGGTFTDFVMVDENRNLVSVGKQLTTPDDPSVAIIEGTERLLQEADTAFSDVHSVVHGTTLVTNTIIERSGAKIGLVTTKGFRDSLEMGKEIRYDLYDLHLEAPPNLVPRHLRREVSERMAPDGEVLLPFDADEFRAVIRSLIEEDNVDAIALCLMHAYRNPDHERMAKKIFEHEFGGVPLSVSSEVAPEIREFERASTTCANAYVQPMMQAYLSTLEKKLQDIGLRGPLYVMLSGGGIAAVRQAREFPIQLIESGPAAGAMAATYFGAQTGEANLISFDMGGTTAKMCLIEGDRPKRSHEFEAGRLRRFKKGSGLPLKVTVVDMIEIGAGGGSIASVDRMGLLKVGPRSAGSKPGPVCYALGGTEPTVTDADLFLGYLDPAYFLGGEMELDLNQVEGAIRSRLAEPLGLDTLTSALGIYSVVNENMAAATRRYMAEKGRDPRDFGIIAFGGAGPVHAYGLAKLLKVKRLIVPFRAGVTSALGFLVSPPAIDLVRSYVSGLDNFDLDTANVLLAEMEEEARTLLVEAGAAPDKIRFERMADMRYVGQGFDVPVPLPDGTLDSTSREIIGKSFFAAYQELFERTVEDVLIEIMSWRLSATGPKTDISLKFGDETLVEGTPEKGTRDAHFPEFGKLTCTVYDRYAFKPGFTFSGPAVIEERESTTVLGPDTKVRVDEYLNLFVDIE
jgi:N-methylhydantoinase A